MEKSYPSRLQGEKRSNEFKGKYKHKITQDVLALYSSTLNFK